MPTIAEKIIQALERSGPLDDDLLAARFGILCQSIKATARHLESYGVIHRYVGSNGKVMNALLSGETAVTSDAPDLPRLQSTSSDGITGDDVKEQH